MQGLESYDTVSEVLYLTKLNFCPISQQHILSFDISVYDVILMKMTHTLPKKENINKN